MQKRGDTERQQELFSSCELVRAGSILEDEVVLGEEVWDCCEGWTVSAYEDQCPARTEGSRRRRAG